MIDQTAAEKAMIVYSERARCDVPDYVAMHAALQAYEAARPKLPTITGLPDKLPDGTPIVGWAWRKADDGEWWLHGGRMIEGPAFESRPVAITEADYE